MSVLAFASARHSPGVTTSVLALAAAWPAGRRVLVLEADPAGGDLACQFRLSAEPSLLTLAAAGRGGVGAAMVWEHAQPLPGGSEVWALPAPVDPRQAIAALTTLEGAGLASTLAELDAAVLVDAGRLDPGSAASGLFASAAVRTLVARPTLNQADHLRQATARLVAEGSSPLQVLVVGEGRWSAVELARAAGGPALLGTLADDPAGAAALTAQGRGVRGIRRSSLWRSARPIAAALAELSSPLDGAVADEAPLSVGPDAALVGGEGRWR